MPTLLRSLLIAAAAFAALPEPSLAADAVDPAPAEHQSFLSGDYALTLGASGFIAPGYEGDDDLRFYAQPLISFGRAGAGPRFVSRSDNISIGVLESENTQVGVTGKLLFERDEDTADELEGLDPVRFGGEAGVFAEAYPLDWLRLRGEVRHGIRTHDAFTGDVAADAFTDVTPAIRVSGGPRASFAGEDYFDTYYGVSKKESGKSGLAPYDPEGGVKSVGLGGEIKWRTTERITTSLFGEYSRLLDEAADSSLVEEQGSPNQFMFGLSATYRFDFSM